MVEDNSREDPVIVPETTCGCSKCDSFDEKPIKQKVILYSCQMIIIFIVVVAAILNLSLDNGNKIMWTSLLSSTLGYVLPSPKLPAQNYHFLKKKGEKQVNL